MQILEGNLTPSHDNWTTFLISNVAVPEETDKSEEIVRTTQLIGRPPIIVLGTFGNLLTFITMQRGSLKEQSTCFYMAILGLADTGRFSLLLFGFPFAQQKRGISQSVTFG